jgi:two-component system sensor histidine kinase TctE
MSRLDLAHLAKDTARELSPKAVGLKVDLGYEGEAHAWMMGSALLLREAISNLIDNALRYGITHDAHVTPTITVRVHVSNSQVSLIVEDNGPGLSDTQREQAFDRFWRGSDLPGGCGLGLSIVQEISKRHGGEVSLGQAGTHGLCVILKFAECAQET